MPSKSPEQHNFMAAVANNPAFAKKAGVPQSVGAEYMRADRTQSRSSQQTINKPKTQHGKSGFFARGGEVAESKAMMKKEIAFMQKKGAPKSMIKHEKAEAGMKPGMTGMKVGGMPTAKTMGPMGMAKGGAKYAAGGYTRAADGVAQRGKTKAKQIKMAGGGRAC
jgi:hypothetical protein